MECMTNYILDFENFITSYFIALEIYILHMNRKANTCEDTPLLQRNSKEKTYEDPSFFCSLTENLNGNLIPIYIESYRCA